MPAQLPAELTGARDRYLSDLQIGEGALIGAHGMRVDADGFCFLDPGVRLMDTSFLSIGVVRTEAGYHVTVRQSKRYSKLTWTREEGDYRGRGFYPVESLAEVEVEE